MSELLLMGAGLLSGLFLGCLLTQSYTSTAISRSQERMQRKIRYWQGETARAREEAERIAQQLSAHGL